MLEVFFIGGYLTKLCLYICVCGEKFEHTSLKPYSAISTITEEPLGRMDSVRLLTLNKEGEHQKNGIIV